MKLRSAAMALGLTAAMAPPGLATAQSTEAPASQSGVQAVLACQSVRGDKAQLACFRRAAKLLGQEPAGSAEASSAQTAELPPPRPFGAPPPHVRPDRPAEARAAVLLVRSMGDLGDGRAILN